MASFENREFLYPEDLEMIKQLNLKFEGKSDWPMFRSYLPGEHPWFLNSDEVRFLTVCLQQALEVSLMVKKTPYFVFLTDDGLYFTRKAEKDGERLGVRLELKERLPMLEEAREHMNAFYWKTMLRQ